MAAAVTRLRVVSFLEGLSFLILLCASVVKRTAEEEIGVQIMGPVHGALFVLYVILALDVKSKLNWNGGTTVKVLLASVVPIAPFFVERWLRTQVPAGAKAQANAKA
jgi:integral membrane protein